MLNRGFWQLRLVRSLWVLGSVVVALLAVITLTMSMETVSHIAVAQDGCPPITSTTKWTEYYGYVTIDEEPAQEGTLVKVYSPRDDLVGCQEVSSPGIYPFLRVYGEEDTTPGMREGEAPRFKVSDIEAAVSSGDPTWHDDKDSHRLDLVVHVTTMTLTLIAQPTSLYVGETSYLTATVVDTYTNPIPNQDVVFTTDLGTLGSDSITETTNASGEAYATLTSTTPGTATIEARTDSVTHTVTVVFTQPPETLVWTASEGFSDTQGANQWYYQYWDGAAYADMEYQADTDMWWAAGTTWCLIWSNGQHPEDYEPARKWVSPYSGVVQISGNARKQNPNCGDGVRVSIHRNRTQLWECYLEFNDDVGIDFNLNTGVVEGDAIYFRVGQRDDSACDGTYFDPTIMLTPIEITGHEVIVSDGTNKMFVERDGSVEIGKPEGWNTLAFDDSSWEQAVPTWEHSVWSQVDPSIDRSDGADWIFDVSNAPQVWDPDEPGSPVNDIVLFRKAFELPGFGTAVGILQITADDQFELYVNGELVGVDGHWSDSHIYDISLHLQAGQNLVAVRVVNGGSSGGLIYRAEVLTYGATHVSINPKRTPIRVGDTAAVDVRVENVRDLYGGDFNLTFDPSFLSVVDADPVADGVQITPGDFLSGAHVVINVADNLSGTIEFVTTLLGEMPPVSGSGTLATITFSAKTIGTSPIHFQSLSLARKDGSLIDTEYEDGEIYSATSLSGTVHLEGRSDHSSVKVSMGKGLPIAHTGPDGSFLLIPVPAGFYTVTFTRTSYLDAQRTVTVAAEDITLEAVEMVAGDVNGDNCINLSDLVLVAADYCSDPPSDERADINGDGHVGLSDLVLVGKNYRRCGPTAAVPRFLHPSVGTTITTTLALEPSAVDSLGDAFEETVKVQDAWNLYGVDFEVTFDPTQLRVVDADPSVEGDQIAVGEVFTGGSGFVAVNKAEEGTIKFAATLVSPTLPFTGTGELARITFKPRRPGVTTLDFAKAEVADPNGHTFPPLTSGAVVTVTFPYRIHLPLVVKRDLMTFEARECPNLSLDIFRELGDKGEIAYTLSDVANFEHDAGDTRRERETCAEALEMAKKLGIRKIVEQMTDLCKSWLRNSL